jgi:hypothetical protein|tara:strand:+ start:704 stop:952 length:249 start_codon:yes stop_codon:yes gene_type:complete
MYKTMSRSWIVVWTDFIKDSSKDYWQVFESVEEAERCYELVVKDHDITAITAVIASSDYEPHAKFNHRLPLPQWNLLYDPAQ